MTNLIQVLAQVNSNSLPKANFDGTVKLVLNTVMGITALISVIFIVVGGLKYTLAAGDPQQIAKAKNTILYAIIGLALAVSTFTILGFVLGGLG